MYVPTVRTICLLSQKIKTTTKKSSTLKPDPQRRLQTLFKAL